MFRIHLTTAWRSVRNRKFYSVINVLGLSVALAAFLLLVSYVQFERTYESGNPKSADIVRLTLDLYKDAEFVVADCETYPAMGPTFQAEMPEVLAYSRLQDLGEIELNVTGKAFLSSKAYAADPSVFSLFNVQFTFGNSSTALTRPGDVVITETFALKLFATVDAVDKSLGFRGRQYRVAAVIKDSPANTHLKFDFLLPFSELASWGYDLNSWGGNNNFTYLLMKPSTDLAAFNKKLYLFSKKRLTQEIVTAEPIQSIHLHSNKTFEPDVNGSARIINFLLLISVLILVIGSANYVNMSTARAAERTREAGLRKVLGSSRSSLIRLFFAEALIINVLAVSFALVLVALVNPYLGGLLGEGPVSGLFNTKNFWYTTAGVFLLNTFLSGLYPAFLLSSVRAGIVTVRSSTGSAKENFFRKALVAGQFAVALVVISGSVIIHQQMRFVTSQDLGMEISEVLALKGPQLIGSDSSLRIQDELFRNKLNAVPGVQAVARAESLPGLGYNSMNTRTDVRRAGQTTYSGYNFYLYAIDEGFVPVMQIGLVAGENFSSVATSNKGRVLINEEAVRLLGFPSAEAAVGQKININSDDNNLVTVLGVMKNYHQQSLKKTQIPMIHWYADNSSSYYAVKLRSDNLRSTIAGIDAVWKANFSGHVLDYFFLDEMFNRQYQADRQFSKILNLFSAFTLFITILGLLGLATYNASRRTREIGIRKVLGASTAGILTLLSRDFLKLVLIAVVIATPVCWFAMDQWLRSFTYRVEISWWVFAVTGLLVMLVAFLTITLQSARAALVNPVKSLRSE